MLATSCLSAGCTCIRILAGGRGRRSWSAGGGSSVTLHATRWVGNSTQVVLSAGLVGVLLMCCIPNMSVPVGGSRCCAS
jgi:hypothetical protein